MSNIPTFEEYIDLMFNKNKHHLDNLLDIIVNKNPDYLQPGKLEGNCLYENCTTNLNDKLQSKQYNIFKIAAASKTLLEIGSNGGHSLLIMLLASPDSIIYSFDLCNHPYTEPCVDYLNKEFNNRIIFQKGDSGITIPKFIKKNPTLEIDAFSIDGRHDYGADADFKNCLALAKNNSIIIWDDSNDHVLSKLWAEYIKYNLIQDITLDYEPTFLYPHAIGVVKLETPNE